MAVQGGEDAILWIFVHAGIERRIRILGLGPRSSIYGSAYLATKTIGHIPNEHLDGLYIPRDMDRNYARSLESRRVISDNNGSCLNRRLDKEGVRLDVVSQEETTDTA